MPSRRTHAQHTGTLVWRAVVASCRLGVVAAYTQTSFAAGCIWALTAGCIWALAGTGMAFATVVARYLLLGGQLSARCGSPSTPPVRRHRPLLDSVRTRIGTDVAPSTPCTSPPWRRTWWRRNDGVTHDGPRLNLAARACDSPDVADDAQGPAGMELAQVDLRCAASTPLPAIHPRRYQTASSSQRATATAAAPRALLERLALQAVADAAFQHSEQALQIVPAREVDHHLSAVGRSCDAHLRCERVR